MVKGYTLVEFLTVASMVGVLASISVPSFQTMQTEAKNIKAAAEVKTLQAIVEKYYKQEGSYPSNLDTTNMPPEINITQKEIIDPFGKPGEAYKLYIGKDSDNKNIYVIYSSGANSQPEFIIQHNKVFNKGDDIIASNIPIIK